MKSKMTGIKLGMVDDHQLFRSGIAAVLKPQTDFNLFFEAENGIDMIEKLKSDDLPDIILMDIKMPKMDGIASVKWLKANFPAIKILVLSMFDDPEKVLSMIRLGVRGYLLKNSHPVELETAIRKIYNEETYYPGFVTDALINSINEDKKGLTFSRREIEFLTLAAKGLKYKEIAEAMGISPRTIDGYNKDLRERINVKSRVNLILFAIENKLIDI